MKYPHIEKKRTDDDIQFIADVELPGSPEQIWELLTTAQDLTSWFPPHAHVAPGKDGFWAVAWGEQFSWVDRIVDWQPGQRLLLQPHPNKSDLVIDGDPVVAGKDSYPYAIEFTLTGRGGSTNLRLVQSNFLASDNWEEELDSFGHGWRHQFYSLAHWLNYHLNEARTFVRSHAEKEGDKATFWERIVAPDGVIRPAEGDQDSPTKITIHVDGHPPMDGDVLFYKHGRQLIANLPGQNNSLFGFGIWHRGPLQWMVSDINFYGMPEADANTFAQNLEAAYQAAI